MAKVAFIGLGVMGYPMARHLLKKGHEVTVYNRTFAKAQTWVDTYGGRCCPTPKEAALGQDIVFTCVGNDNDLREVVLGGMALSMAWKRALCWLTILRLRPMSLVSFIKC